MKYTVDLLPWDREKLTLFLRLRFLVYRFTIRSYLYVLHTFLKHTHVHASDCVCVCAFCFILRALSCAQILQQNIKKINMFVYFLF